MNARHVFPGPRPIARHAKALLRTGPTPAELLPALTRAAERMVRVLHRALAPLLGGKAPAVRCIAAPAEAASAALATRIAPLAANCLHAAGPAGAALFLSVEARTVFTLVDRAFGGAGEAPQPLPEQFPMSADLMAARIERAVATAAAAALEQNEDLPLVRRDGSFARLAPYADDTPLAVFEFSVDEPGLAPWSILAALPMTALPGLLAPQRAAAPKGGAHRGPASPDAAPFRDLPLPLRAVMAEVDLPVATVSALKVGQVLPVAIARIVPLRIGARTIAHGTVGAVDDRVAVQLTRAF